MPGINALAQIAKWALHKSVKFVYPIRLVTWITLYAW